MTSFISALLFGGGTCALIYQTVWLREFRLIFGSSTPASAAVLALFMGGLGVGGLLIGRRAEKSTNPLRMYAQLELGIAFTSALTPFLLDGVRWLYVHSGGVDSWGYAIATLLRLAMAALVMGLPVLLMGATLPAASRAVTQIEDHERTSLALLYGANTIGAVIGALSTTFALFEIYGVRTTLWMACLLNGLIGVLANALARKQDEPNSAPLGAGKAVATSTADELATTTLPRERPPAYLLAASFLAGFAFFVAELVWYRMCAPILGGSTFTFGLILALALLGIGLGGFLYGLAPPSRPSRSILALTFGLEAFAILLPLAAGDHLAHLTFFMREFGAASFLKLTLGWGFIAGFLVLPAAVISGYQFPLLVALRGRGPTAVSLDVATIYGANTSGSILGSILGGFVFLPWLTAPGTWRLCGVLLALTSFVLVIYRPWSHDVNRRGGIAAFVLVFVSLGLTQAPGPSAFWRHAPIGAGRANLHAKSQNEYKRMVSSANEKVLEAFDGRESSVAFLASNGLAFSVNGKIDGNVVGDATTTVGLGIIPAALHANVNRALVIGLGSGQTAGWLGSVPSIEKVDVIELEPVMKKFAQKCRLSNFDVLNNPRVHVIIGDGREVMASSTDHYDLIIAEPSNPYRAGIASLYSVDFYKDAAERLEGGGLFAQWLQGYEVHPETFSTVVSTMRAVFPMVSVFTLAPGDFLLVGSREPMVIQADLLRERLHHHPYSTALERVFAVSGLEGLFSMHIANADFTQRLDRGPDHWNTQDKPILEYQFARFVGRPGSHTSAERVWQAASQNQLDRPNVVGEVDWNYVAEQRGRNLERSGQDVPAAWSKQTPHRQKYLRLLNNGKFKDAYALLEQLPSVRAEDLFERLRRVELQIWNATSDDAPGAYRAELQSLEAAGMTADVAWLHVLEAKQAKTANEELLIRFERAVRLAREDPWFDSLRVRRIAEYAGKDVDEKTAHQLANLLLQGPFASYRLEDWRWRWAQNWSVKGMPERVSPHCVRAFSARVSWDEQSLVRRALCYELNQVEPALLEEAQAKIAAFLTNETKEAVWTDP